MKQLKHIKHGASQQATIAKLSLPEAHSKQQKYFNFIFPDSLFVSSPFTVSIRRLLSINRKTTDSVMEFKLLN